MAQFQKDKVWKRVLYSKPTIIALAVLTLFFAYNVTGIIAKSRETDKNLGTALSELDSLKSKQASLQSSLDTLSTPAGVDDAIREKYRVVKGGEGLVVIVNDQNKNGTAAAANAPAAEHGFWNFIKSMFTKKTAMPVVQQNN